MLFFLGDLSSNDAVLLTRLAQNARCILEFGVGGSTQVIAQSMLADAEFIGIETKDEWIVNTKSALATLGIAEAAVRFLRYDDVFADGILMDRELAGKQFDLIFVDGEIHLRESFVRQLFKLLRVGGRMLVHDTRREADARYVLEFCANHHLEIARITLNPEHSNISIIEKKAPEPYEDWNKAEGRESWEANYAPAPSDWLDQLKRKRAGREGHA